MLERAFRLVRKYPINFIAIIIVIFGFVLLLWRWQIMHFPALARNNPASQHNSSSAERRNPIQQENQLSGTAEWKLAHPAAYDTQSSRFPSIEGYAWTTSATAGDTISFSVSTTAPFFTANIYRLGWYQGKGGRLIQSIPETIADFNPMPSMDSQTGLIEANWPVAFTLKVQPSWVSGIYLVKLTAATGEQNYIPFVVRSDRASDFAFIHPSSTDAAYNNWGGKSLYDFNSTGGHRANKVSFDRPFNIDGGAGYVLTWEYPMIRWLEGNGYDVSYLSTSDVQDYPTLLRNHHGVLIVGHNEYWSKAMRNNLEAAVNSGVNLANFAANSIYWQIRFEPSTAKHTPERIIVGYKDAARDPLTGKDNSQVTVQFRQSPVNRPEQTLLGSMWAGSFNWGTNYDWVVADASNWVFANTGLKNGDHLPGLVGYEYDNVSRSTPMPAGTDVLSSSHVHDIAQNRDDVSSATVYTAPGGARVFNAATIQWSWGLDDYGNHNVVNPGVQKITRNVLVNFLTVLSARH